MTKLGDTYKCNVCGNTVEILNPGVGELVCCGQPMVINQPEVKEEIKEEITRQEEPAKEEPQEEPVI